MGITKFIILLIAWGTLSGCSKDASADTQAPTVPAGLVSHNITPFGFKLNWEASVDNIGVTGYEVLRNGISIGTTATTSISVTGLSAATTYTMTVRARDASANCSAQSSGLLVTTNTGSSNSPLVGQAVTTSFEAELTANGGRHIDVRANWVDVSDSMPFSVWRSTFVDACIENGTISEVTLQPKDITNAEINAGTWDTYFTQLATDIKEWNHEIWIRLMHEWNGDWYTWCVGINGNTNDSYIAAYRRVVTLFRNVGATNVKFEWNINYTNSGSNTFLGAYPGSDFVDCVGVDVYNWGTAQTWSHWESFDEAVWPAYSALATLNKPVIISEWGCGEPGGNKAQWISDAFNIIRFSGKYDLIDAVIWFDVGGYTPDFQIDTSPEARKAYNASINYKSDPIAKSK